jgi:hypothetical protein
MGQLNSTCRAPPRRRKRYKLHLKANFEKPGITFLVPKGCVEPRRLRDMGKLNATCTAPPRGRKRRALAPGTRSKAASAWRTCREARLGIRGLHETLDCIGENYISHKAVNFLLSIFPIAVGPCHHFANSELFSPLHCIHSQVFT